MVILFEQTHEDVVVPVLTDADTLVLAAPLDETAGTVAADRPLRPPA